MVDGEGFGEGRFVAFREVPDLDFVVSAVSVGVSGCWVRWFWRGRT
jgi:hypothetical protein